MSFSLLLFYCKSTSNFSPVMPMSYRCGWDKGGRATRKIHCYSSSLMVGRFYEVSGSGVNLR